MGLGCAVLAGCVSIPSDGPVVKARPVEGGRAGAVQYYPAGPSLDDTPGELIRGFLRASADYTDDHAVARGFLMSRRQLSWRPESSVVVYAETGLRLTVTRAGVSLLDPGPTVAVPVPSTSSVPPSRGVSATPSSASLLDARPALGEQVRVTVQLPVHARIDKSGRYVLAAPQEVETRYFELTGTERGWRIDDLDEGLMITRENLKQTFRAVKLYFADPTGTYLVPDLRWFPGASSSTPSQVVSALLAGPSDWLEPAVSTGAPSDTKLTVNAVKIVDGLVTVDLNSAIRLATARQRLILKAQLERTIATLGLTTSQVNGVAITVEQQKFELQPPAGEATEPRAAGGARPTPRTASTRLPLGLPPDIDARPVVLDAAGAIARAGVETQPVSGLEALGGAGVTDPAVDADGRAYAVLADGRTRLRYAVPSGTPLTLVVGTALVPPSFDPFGWVWTSQADSLGTLLAARPDAGVSRISAAWLHGRQVRSLRISREGARAVLVTARPGSGHEVLAAAVIRNSTGTPIALSEPVRLLEDAQEVAGAAWVDSTQVVVLARRPGFASQPWIVEIDGDVHAAGTAPIQGTAVTAGNSESDLYVQVSGGAVRARVGVTWMDLPGVRYAAMPG
ncbi:MAG: hypothetical protein QG622_2628 [Actinomycetota bacterium]|nr:hypothetical protein [Actinomycetota bacterium]